MRPARRKTTGEDEEGGEGEEVIEAELPQDDDATPAGVGLVLIICFALFCVGVVLLCGFYIRR